MARCIFCSNLAKPGRGKTIVASDGRAQSFCSSKCYKNFLLGRSPKKVGWVRKKKKKGDKEKVEKK